MENNNGSVSRTVNKIVKKYLYKAATPNILQDMKSEIQKAGGDVKNISIVSKDHIFSLDTSIDEDVVHYYCEGGMWKNKIV